MGKIVKYCSSCDEGFVEKFGFCPNCAAPLQAFEMNPVEAPKAAPAEPVSEPPVPEVLAKPEPAPPVQEPVLEAAPIVEAAPIIEAAPIVEDPAVEEPVLEVPAIVEEPVIAAAPVPEPVKAAEPVVKETPKAAPKTETVKAAPKTRTVPVAAPIFSQSIPVDVDRKPTSFEAEHDRYVADGGFYVTVIEEKNSKQRNALLVGALGLILFAFMTGLVASIFSKDLDVGSINDDVFNAVIVDDVPTTVEEEVHKKEKDQGGGGGGGGDNDPKPASQGERPPMRTEQEFKPSATADRLTNPTIPIQMSIKGPVNEKFTVDSRYGLKVGGTDPSNGSGSGGGIGSGRDGGVGSGNGPGSGPGSGGGLGSGCCGGIGGGEGPGGDAPPKVAGVSQGIKILSKPRPGYTDAARQNNIQGTVILRVTFQANGQIGGISPVKGLGNGLTEQAIAAARRISFEPAKVNGVAQSVTKQIEYTFSIY